MTGFNALKFMIFVCLLATPLAQAQKWAGETGIYDYLEVGPRNAKRQAKIRLTKGKSLTEAEVKIIESKGWEQRIDWGKSVGKPTWGPTTFTGPFKSGLNGRESPEMALQVFRAQQNPYQTPDVPVFYERGFEENNQTRTEALKNSYHFNPPVRALKYLPLMRAKLETLLSNETTWAILPNASPQDKDKLYQRIEQIADVSYRLLWLLDATVAPKFILSSERDEIRQGRETNFYNEFMENPRNSKLVNGALETIKKNPQVYAELMADPIGVYFLLVAGNAHGVVLAQKVAAMKNPKVTANFVGMVEVVRESRSADLKAFVADYLKPLDTAYTDLELARSDYYQYSGNSRPAVEALELIADHPKLQDAIAPVSRTALRYCNRVFVPFVPQK